MKRTIVFATHNEDKAREIREMVAGLDIEVLSLNDVHLKITREETAPDFVGNAKIKAEEIAEQCDYPVFADDSGLWINDLDGFPGVHSARWMEGKSYDEKNKELIRMLEGHSDRSAKFISAMVYIDKKHNIEKSFVGEVEGEIIKEFDPTAKAGFGYDPIFYSYDIKKCFGHATPEEKDSVSHRGRALRALIAYLESSEA